MEKIARIFYLEPFLIKAERHFIEVTLAIDKYLSDKRNLKHYIVGNKNFDKDVRRLLPKIIPGITQTCFESLDDKGKSFYLDLTKLHKVYHFSYRDLLIIPTAYENQILGLGKFIDYISNRYCPKIVVQFHQLFPPVSESDDIIKLSFRRFWINRLRKAFQKANSTKISYWVTESHELKRDFQRISGRAVGVLPVPYPILTNYANENISLFSSGQERLIKLAFLGEGRQEKGLPYFLKAIRYINKQKNPFLFIIQNMNPRGYSIQQKKEFDNILSDIRKHSNVLVIEGGIPPIRFHSFLRQIDGVVLPYNPINYYRRTSGLLIQAAIFEKPVISSVGTWAESIICKKQTSGLIFYHNMNNDKKTVSSLVKCIKLFSRRKEELQKLAKLYSHHFKAYNTAEEYLRRIFSHYEQ